MGGTVLLECHDLDGALELDQRLALGGLAVPDQIPHKGLSVFYNTVLRYGLVLCRGFCREDCPRRWRGRGNGNG